MKECGRFFGFILMTTCSFGSLYAEGPHVAYDMQMAKEICTELPLDQIEGIWEYPDDHITVMMLRNEKLGSEVFPVYDITVVETTDSFLHPGDYIGKLEATAKDGVYKIELLTEKKKELLLSPKSVTAELSKEADALLIKKQKSPFRLRLNLSFNRLLPGFWKIVSTGISPNNNTDNTKPPVGMKKIYPSYDGNGSVKGRIRYL